MQSQSTNLTREVVERISEICRKVRATDQAVYLALEMKYKPSQDKEILKKNLIDYNEALLELRKAAVDYRDEVMRQAKDIFDEGLPKYFQIVYAEHKLQDNLDMTSTEIDDILVHRRTAMNMWDNIHFELGIPW